MPPPTLDFIEKEACIGWHGDLVKWKEQSLDVRAQCIAHHIHRAIREAFAIEHSMNEKDNKGKGGSNDGGNAKFVDYTSYLRSQGVNV